jgi:hypothetical protein
MNSLNLRIAKNTIKTRLSKPSRLRFARSIAMHFLFTTVAYCGNAATGRNRISASRQLAEGPTLRHCPGLYGSWPTLSGTESPHRIDDAVRGNHESANRLTLDPNLGLAVVDPFCHDYLIGHTLSLTVGHSNAMRCTRCCPATLIQIYTNKRRSPDRQRACP